MLVAALSKAGQGPHSAPATLEPPIGKLKLLYANLFHYIIEPKKRGGLLKQNNQET